jgi:hypothetical protein
MHTKGTAMSKEIVLAVWPDVVVRKDRTKESCAWGAYRKDACIGLGSSEEETWSDVTTAGAFMEDVAANLAVTAELLEALKALRSFMWAEGYADQTVEMAQADAAIAKAEPR